MRTLEGIRYLINLDSAEIQQKFYYRISYVTN